MGEENKSAVDALINGERVNESEDISQETSEISDQTAAVNDDDFDLNSLLKSAKEEPEPEPEKPTKKLTALDRLKEAKKNSGGGLVVENKELESGSEQQLVDKSSQDADDETAAYNENQDKIIDVANKLNFKRQPKDGLEMAEVIDNLEKAADTGELSETFVDKYIDKNNILKDQNSDSSSAPTYDISDITDDVEDDAREGEALSEEKQKLVNILIDKTGMGADFAFTPEERNQIVTASQIKVTEVEEVSLSTIKVKKPNKSFMETVNEYQFSASKVPVVFPASRFRAEMTGLSYGEMGDLALNLENMTTEQYRKKFTVIYNKMINPSIGAFKSFEDFLKKIAYVDIDIAIYGIIVATFPDVEDILLKCNRPDCQKSFNHKYSPRALFKLNKTNDKFIDAFKDVVDSNRFNANDLAETSPVNEYIRIKLPNSGFIVEIGLASAYDYLYGIYDNITGDKFKEKHPNDVNGILQLNAILLSNVKGIYVPDGEEYLYYDDFDDIIDALYMIKPDEVAILSNIIQKYTKAYETVFEFNDVKCPHCGSMTERIPVNISDLLFLKYQRLMSTEVNISNISPL